MRFAREAFFARHKHDKQFAELGERRRRTEMIVILLEVPWRVAQFVCQFWDGCHVISCDSTRAQPFFEPGASLKCDKMKLCVIVDRQTPRGVHVAVFALQLSATLHP